MSSLGNDRTKAWQPAAHRADTVLGARPTPTRGDERRVPVRVIAAAVVPFVLILLFNALVRDQRTAETRSGFGNAVDSATGGEEVVTSTAAAMPEGTAEGTPTVSSSPGGAGTGAVTALTASWRAYAVPLPELQGLAPNTPAGTFLELWATWDRPLTDEPRLQRLIERVLLEQIAPAVTPQAPDVVMLRVRPRDLGDLLWADQYGRLSAVVLP